MNSTTPGATPATKTDSRTRITRMPGSTPMMPVATAHRGFELQIEQLPVDGDGDRDRDGDDDASRRVELGAGATLLEIAGEEIVLEPQISEAGAGSGSRGVGTGMLAASAAGHRLRVNGEHAGRLVLLVDGDVLELGTTSIAEVTVSTRWRLGAAPEASVGGLCPICRQQIKDTQRVWLCPGCGTVLHAEPGSSADVLKCFDHCTECPTCQLSIDPADQDMADQDRPSDSRTAHDAGAAGGEVAA